MVGVLWENVTEFRCYPSRKNTKLFIFNQ